MLRDNRRDFEFENIKSHFVTLCWYSFKINITFLSLLNLYLFNLAIDLIICTYF